MPAIVLSQGANTNRRGMSKPSRTWNKARTAYGRGDSGRALKLLEKRVSEDPADTACVILLAEYLDELGRLDDAVDVLEASFKERPDDLQLKAFLGESLVLHGRLEEGRHLLEEVRSADPHEPRTYLGLSALAVQQERWDDLLPLVGDAQRHCAPLDPGAASVFASDLVGVRTPEARTQAESLLRHSLALDPSRPESHLLLSILIERDSPEEARRHADKARSLWPKGRPMTVDESETTGRRIVWG